MGIVISKKVGKAVLRNYVKRVMRELFRTTKNQIKKNIHMIIIPSKKYRWEDLNFDDIKNCWMETISKINKINNGLC